ncbi:fructosamine kinase family protein [Mucilaginibacter terrae]|uniref:fructosamine kinase family protein n=1 Tax=Mucilaginibacter terrae TaxID=1955052 RepID=UPI0036438338
MAISKQFTVYLEQQLGGAIGQHTRLQHVSAVSGGSINAAYCLHTSAGDYMMKRKNKSAYPNMFIREAEGLTAIKNTKTIAVPKVILLDNYEDDSFLVLEWIESMRPTPDASRLLGRQLAAMHSHTAKQFGFPQDNYMGSLIQSNSGKDTWADFFVKERLQPMVQIARDKNLLNKVDVGKFDSIYKNLPGLFNEEPPSLIHGDLWGGNYLISTVSKPYLIDPAVSYGHREFDIAMTKLFGGFGTDFYSSYQESFPLVQGWQQRVDLWNLYPLLLHLNLFGTGYLSQVKNAVMKYV